MNTSIKELVSNSVERKSRNARAQDNCVLVQFVCVRECVSTCLLDGDVGNLDETDWVYSYFCDT